jgi:S1-C subfamily serine protease
MHMREERFARDGLPTSEPSRALDAAVDHITDEPSPVPPPDVTGHTTPLGFAPRRRTSRLRSVFSLCCALLVAGATGAGAATALEQATVAAPVGSLLAALHLDPAAIAARVDPSVVDITVQLAFGQGEAAGTGIVLTSTGEVLTNNHVVENATRISVTVPGRHYSYSARVLGVDPTADVALLQMENVAGLRPAALGSSRDLAVGQRVVAIGNALGRNGTPAVTSGTITALNRSITAADPTNGAEQLHGLIETSAPLAPGDSGGPLVNALGQVVGMDTAAATSPDGTSSRAGYAIPIDTARTIVHEILAGTPNPQIVVGARAFLGVQVTDASQAGFFPGVGFFGATSQGALILGVVPGSPADDAGLLPGDVIVSFAGQAVPSQSTLRRLILEHRPGQTVEITWIDPFGQEETASVRLVAGPVV